MDQIFWCKFFALIIGCCCMHIINPREGEFLNFETKILSMGQIFWDFSNTLVLNVNTQLVTCTKLPQFNVFYCAIWIWQTITNHGKIEFNFKKNIILEKDVQI
jgi:hypothetical protein